MQKKPAKLLILKELPEDFSDKKYYGEIYVYTGENFLQIAEKEEEE